MSARTDSLARELLRLGQKIAASIAAEARLRGKAAEETRKAGRAKSPTLIASHQRRAEDYGKRAEKELADRARLEARRTKMQQRLDDVRGRAERMLKAEQQEQEQRLREELDRARAEVAASAPAEVRPPDVFICHAHEDKDAVARPLADALLAEGVPRVWFDEYSLKVGASLRQSIDKGLASCRFGVVVLSRGFFARHWTQYELDGLIERMNDEGRDLLLPIWHDITKAEVIANSPALAGRVALLTAAFTIPEIAARLAEVILADGRRA